MSNANVPGGESRALPPIASDTWVAIGIVCALALSPAGAAAQPVGPFVSGRSVPLEASVAEIRVSSQWITLLHRRSGSWPKPGDDWVTVLDRQGAMRTRVVPSDAIADARMVNVQHAEAHESELFIAAVVANERDQFASVIIRYDLPSGRLARVTRTNPTACSHLTVDATSVWCLGTNVELLERSNRDFHLLYRFSHDGLQQDSALSWLRDVPKATRPWGYGASGPPTLASVPGGVRAWLPNAGRFVTWIPGQPVRVKEIPATLASSEPQDVVDTGRTVILSTFEQPSTDRLNRARRIRLWDADATLSDPGMPLVPVGRRIVGRLGSELIVWDRYGQRLEWIAVDWIQ